MKIHESIQLHTVIESTSFFKKTLAMVKKKWHLIQVKKNWESRVSRALARNNVEIFFPLITGEKTNWLEKKTGGLIPLFPSHLFVNIEYLSQRHEINQTRGVTNFYYRLSEPAIISPEDIDAIKLFTKMYRNITYGKTYVPSLVSDENKLLVQRKEMATEAICSNEEILFLPSLGFYLTGELIRTPEMSRVLHGENVAVSRRILLYQSEEDDKSEITIAS